MNAHTLATFLTLRQITEREELIKANLQALKGNPLGYDEEQIARCRDDAKNALEVYKQAKRIVKGRYPYLSSKGGPHKL